MSSHSSHGSSKVHYSVTKGASRRDPHFITCLNSDANPSKWKEPGPTVDKAGATCYWKTDDRECHSMSERWKKTLGKTVAKLLGLTDDASDEDWKVQDFPKDYKLFRHVKGPRDDYYLFGSEWVTKFRTANEFSPHFHWLCTYEPTKANRIYCKCKYCSGLNQGWVNSSLGISDQSKRFSSPIFDQKSSHNKRKAEEEMVKENQRKRMTSGINSSSRQPRVSQKAVSSRKSLPTHLLNTVSNGGVSGRRSTFSGPYVNKDRDRDLSELKCTFRTAELVWCRLDVPIDGSNEGRPDLRIDYWPAICEERVLVSNSEVSASQPSTETASMSAGSLSLKIQQRFQWKVRLLATSDVYCKDESQLLAYLNYPPPLNIYQLPINPEGLKYIHDGHESDRPTISSFSTFTEALSLFALSLQITAHIKKSFTLMDRYDIALLRRLEARGQNIPIEDMQILYEDSNLPWYQYIWWGAEKIWSGELIRLIVTAAELPPGLRPLTPDNHSCCFFLKLTGFYRNTQEEGMAKGAIFELSPIAQGVKDESERNPEFEESNSLPGVQQIKRYMPEAPSGYFFRRLTPVGKEHHLVLQHIAGRYYPPRHPIVLDPSNLNQPDSPAPYSIEGRSLILSGLGEGRWLHMHCETWTLDRKECFKEAESSAEQELIAFCSKSGDETIKTKSVTVIESENNDVSDAVENGIEVAGSNGDIVMHEADVAAINHCITSNHTEGDHNILTLGESTNNHTNMARSNVTPIDPPMEISHVRQNNIPSDYTSLEKNVTQAGNMHDDINMNPNIDSSADPQLRPKISASTNLQITRLSSDEENNAPLDDAHLTVVQNNNDDVNMEPNTVTPANAHIASSSAEEGNAVLIDNTHVENITTPSENKNNNLNPKSNCITSISVEEWNAIPPGRNQVMYVATPDESTNNDMNLQPNILTSVQPHIASISVEGITQTDVDNIGVNLKPHKVTSINPSRVQAENSLPLPSASTQPQNNATLTENTTDDMNVEPNTENLIGSHVRISAENDKPAPINPVEVNSSVSLSESSNRNLQPSHVPFTDPTFGKLQLNLNQTSIELLPYSDEALG